MAALLAVLGLCLVVGYLGRASGRLPASTSAVLNRVILDLALPALVLRVVHGVRLEPKMAVGASMMWLVFALAFVTFRALGPLSRLPPERVSCLVLTAGLGNTAFVGLPLLQALMGEGALGPAVIIDQLGSFIALSTVGVWVAHKGVSIVRRVVTFPPFLALVLAVALRPLPFPEWLDAALAYLAAPLTPLALLSVGAQLSPGEVPRLWRPLALGLAVKLLVAPLLVAVVAWPLLSGGSQTVWQVAVLQAAMAPMVSGGVLAIENDLDPPLAASMIALGVPLSLVTVPAIALLIGAV